MGLSHGLVLQILAREAKQYRRLAGELLLFSGHLQNIRLFIVSGNADRTLDQLPIHNILPLFQFQ